MFEISIARVRAKAEVRARAVAAQLAGRASEVLPAGLFAQAQDEGVKLSGKGLRRRLALDPALRSIWERLK